MLKSPLNDKRLASLADPTQLNKITYYVKVPQRTLVVLSKPLKKYGKGLVKTGISDIDKGLAEQLVPCGYTIEGLSKVFLINPKIQFNTIKDIIDIVFNINEYFEKLFKPDNDPVALSISKEVYTVLDNISALFNFLITEYLDVMTNELKRLIIKGEFTFNVPDKNMTREQIASGINLQFNELYIDDLIYIRNKDKVKLL